MTDYDHPFGFASWTPDQAAAVLEVIDHLIDRNNDVLYDLHSEVWRRYGRDIDRYDVQRRRQLSLWPTDRS